jgi:Family of unknown function (DUF6488)
MRKMLIILASAATVMTAVPATAHPDPYEEYERTPTVPELARAAIAKLIAQSKLPASWSTAAEVRTFTRMRGSTEQLIVEFRNAGVREPAKRTLFVVMTRSGQFISANHRLT